MIQRTNYYCPIQEKPPPIGGGTGYTRISQYDSDFLNFVLPVPRGLNSQLPRTVTVLIPVLRKASLIDLRFTWFAFPISEVLVGVTGIVLYYKEIKRDFDKGAA